VTDDLDLPPVGLGTMGIDDPDVVATALEMGYRHLDTAQVYDNEAVVGEGLARADVDREDVVVATKVWADDCGPDDVRPSTEASLDRLGLEYVDLLYVHRPYEPYTPEGTMPAFADLVDEGLVRHVSTTGWWPTPRWSPGGPTRCRSSSNSRRNTTPPRRP
jgi:2,5-diketo-D-gluconate reductase B